MKKIIYTKNAPDAIGPYSQAYLCNGMLFSSGQIAIDPKTNEFIGGDIKEQTERIMKNLEAVLKEAGFSFEDVIKTTCFLKDMNDFAAFNEIYAGYFTGKPARSCVAAKTLPKGALVEVDTVCLL